MRLRRPRQWKLYVYLLPHKPRESPPCGLTFAGCSHLLLPSHKSYPKSLSPRTRARQLSEYKSGDQPVTECWTAGFKGLNLRHYYYYFFFACRIQNQFIELRGSAEAVWLLIFYLWEDCGPRGNPTCLFTACFRFVLPHYGPWDWRLHSAESPVFMPRALFVNTVSHLLPYLEVSE